MIRFFVTSRELSGPSHTLTGENAKHAKVLRLKAGEEVLLCDGAGQECLCTVADPESLTLTLGECRPSASEAKVRASVYMAFPKADKLEHVIQKATELGAVSVLARRYVNCYARDQYVSSPFYVYISKSKNGQQYLDSLGGAATTSRKEKYVEGAFLVERAALHTAGPLPEKEE